MTPLRPRDRVLTRGQTAAAGVVIAVAMALVARAMAPSWTAAATRAAGGGTFLAAVLLHGWVEGRRPRPFPLPVSAAVILAAGALGGAIAAGLEGKVARSGAAGGLILGGVWLVRYVRERRSRARGPAAGSGPRP